MARVMAKILKVGLSEKYAVQHGFWAPTPILLDDSIKN
jgi:hypothetical protein